MIASGALLVFGGGLLFVIGTILAACPSEHNVGWHCSHGLFCVRYPDGRVSQPFRFSVARDYQKIFGGRIVWKWNA